MSNAYRDVDIGQWGKALLEEVLFRAGRELRDPDTKPERVTASVTFEIAAQDGEHALHLIYERADQRQITLRIQLDDEI